MASGPSLPSTPGSTSGHDSQEGEWLELRVQVRNVFTGDILFTCSYDAASDTVGWLRGLLWHFGIIPPNTSPVLSTIPRLSSRQPKTLSDLGKLLCELWNEESTDEGGEDAMTLILGVVFVPTEE